MKNALAENTQLTERYVIRKLDSDKIHNQINYLCVDTSNGNQVIIKEFYPAYAKRSESGALEYSRLHDDDMAKFVRYNEHARMYGQIPTIIKVFEVFYANNTAYAVCEYFSGRTVAELISRGYEVNKPTVQNILRMLLKTNQALAKFNICNRNFHPDNIMVTKDEYLKIIEFKPGKSSLYEIEAVKSIAALGFYIATGEDTDAVSNVKKHRADPRMQDMLKYLLFVVNEQAEVTTDEFYNAVELSFDARQVNMTVSQDVQMAPEPRRERIERKPASAKEKSNSKKLVVSVIAAILALALAVYGAITIIGKWKNNDDNADKTTDTNQGAVLSDDTNEQGNKDAEEGNKGEGAPTEDKVELKFSSVTIENGDKDPREIPFDSFDEGNKATVYDIDFGKKILLSVDGEADKVVASWKDSNGADTIEIDKKNKKNEYTFELQQDDNKDNSVQYTVILSDKKQVKMDKILLVACDSKGKETQALDYTFDSDVSEYNISADATHVMITGWNVAEYDDVAVSATCNNKDITINKEIGLKFENGVAELRFKVTPDKKDDYAANEYIFTFTKESNQ